MVLEAEESAFGEGMNRPLLYSYWQAARNTNAWMLPCFTEDEESYFEGIIADCYNWTRGLKKQHNTHTNRPEVDRTWADERKKEYTENKIKELKQEMVSERIFQGKAAKEGDDFAVAMSADRLKEIIRDIRRLSAPIYRPEYAENRVNVTEEMIDRARAYPIKALIGTDKDMISCPLHDDASPSACLKNNFFYCFSCSARMDSIAWLRLIEKYSFVDAVIKLQ